MESGIDSTLAYPAGADITYLQARAGQGFFLPPTAVTGGVAAGTVTPTLDARGATWPGEAGVVRFSGILRGDWTIVGTAPVGNRRALFARPTLTVRLDVYSGATLLGTEVLATWREPSGLAPGARQSWGSGGVGIAISGSRRIAAGNQLRLRITVSHPRRTVNIPPTSDHYDLRVLSTSRVRWRRP